jgi:uncharacterized membrane protein YphA (DoxX/SURF4 family)
MSVITNLERWGNSHRPGFLDIFRIVLGAFITYKGLYFITHMPELEMTTSGINVYFAGMTLAHYIVFAHILGGPLIFFGLFTRIVSAIQLPILIGAVFMVKRAQRFSLHRTPHGTLVFNCCLDWLDSLHGLWSWSLFHRR